MVNQFDGNSLEAASPKVQSLIRQFCLKPYQVEPRRLSDNSVIETDTNKVSNPWLDKK